MVDSRSRSSVFDKCRTNYEMMQVCTISGRNGNSVGDCSRDLASANSDNPLSPDFRRRCVEKLDKLGDGARDFKKHDEAIGYYSNALSLDPTENRILLKRSTEVWSVFHVTSNRPQ